VDLTLKSLAETKEVNGKSNNPRKQTECHQIWKNFPHKSPVEFTRETA
jgi:hypothetical protein